MSDDSRGCGLWRLNLRVPSVATRVLPIIMRESCVGVHTISRRHGWHDVHQTMSSPNASSACCCEDLPDSWIWWVGAPALVRGLCWSWELLKAALNQSRSLLSETRSELRSGEVFVSILFLLWVLCVRRERAQYTTSATVRSIRRNTRTEPTVSRTHLRSKNHNIVWFLSGPITTIVSSGRWEVVERWQLILGRLHTRVIFVLWIWYKA